MIDDPAVFAAIELLQASVGDTAERHGWHEPYEHDREGFERHTSPAERIAVLHGRLARITEALRETGGDVNRTWLREEDGRPRGVVYEAADTIIGLFDFCAEHKLPLSDALRDMMRFNETREPRRGGKRL